MDRKNVEPAAAALESSQATAFCTAMTSTCMTPPSPTPSTNMYMPLLSTDVWTPIKDSRYRPTAISGVPSMGKALCRPHCVTRIPDTIDVGSTPARRGQPRVGGAGPSHHLHALRKICDSAKHPKAHQKPNRAGGCEDAVAKQRQREPRLSGAPLHRNERHDHHGRDTTEPKDLPRAPGTRHPRERRQQHERAGRAGQQRRAGIVDDVGDAGQRAGQHHAGDNQRHDAHRHVDVKSSAKTSLGR